MFLVVALGGNALLRRGQPLDIETQRENARTAARVVADLVRDHTVLLTHGNGPQVGLLALQSAAGVEVPATPLDVLGAESEGMIGYLLEQELENVLDGRDVATLLTQVVVDGDDPAFRSPTKPIGPVYTEVEAGALAAARGWSIAPDGDGWRRTVPSPRPQSIVGQRTIEILLEFGVVVICTGGGGIPVVRAADGSLHGVEAVIDKDRSAALLAAELGADALLLLTDVDALMADWGTPGQRRVQEAHPDSLAPDDFAAGSMGPKVAAACEFASRTGKPAYIGALGDAVAVLAGDTGTRISIAGAALVLGDLTSNIGCVRAESAP